MAAAFAESLQREVDTAIREAASHRGGLRRRVAAACDRIRQQQALARAEALTPLFRADLLRRGRAIQKNRARLMQTLKRFARVLPSGDLCESSGLPNVVAVFRVAQEALRVEEELAYWRQPLPREEAWCAVCTAVREGGYRADAPLQLPAATEQQQHRRKERQEAALEHLLFPVCTNVGSGEEEETAAAAVAAPAIPWIALPCFCTVTHFCRHEQVPVVAAAAKGNSGSQPVNPGASEEEDDAMHDEVAEAERGVSSDGRVTQMVLDATAAHLGRLGVRAGDCSSSGEDEEVAESALEEVRLRVSLEVAARVTACRHAVESLAAGEDGMLLDGVTTVTAAAPHAVPVMALVLPPMEQLFFALRTPLAQQFCGMNRTSDVRLPPRVVLPLLSMMMMMMVAVGRARGDGGCGRKAALAVLTTHPLVPACCDICWNTSFVPLSVRANGRALRHLCGRARCGGG
ncbi:hypothetical protein TCDM_06948 [Trypanosoma cruzi Dm28c]|uniref:Uncharacterized protein n=1 Tax=Trypanosoma cruzi Dm28c TaxID=1416333 RepID=V5BFJ5_TRYCR|nr:hypothetical protein TCDM_06948 [Trypanosoma cruzi Dm28c]